MSVIIKHVKMAFKDPTTSEYTSIDAIADRTTDQLVGQIQSEGAAQVSAIGIKGQQTRDSIPEDYSALSNEVSAIKSAIGGITGNEAIPMKENTVVYTATNSYDESASNYYNSAIVECSAGDIFTLNVTGGASSTILAYAFYDSENHRLNNVGTGFVADNLIIVAPENANILIINDRSKSKTSYKGKIIKLTADNLNEAVFNGETDSGVKPTGAYTTVFINSYDFETSVVYKISLRAEEDITFGANDSIKLMTASSESSVTNLLTLNNLAIKKGESVYALFKPTQGYVNYRVGSYCANGSTGIGKKIKLVVSALDSEGLLAEMRSFVDRKATATLSTATTFFVNGVSLQNGHIYRIKFTPSADMDIKGNAVIKIMTSASDGSVKQIYKLPLGTIKANTSVYVYFVSDADYFNHRIGTSVASGQGTTVNIPCTMEVKEITDASDGILSEIGTINRRLDADSILAMNGKFDLYNKFTEAFRGYSAIDGGHATPDHNFTVVQFSDIHGEALNAQRINEFRSELPEWCLGGIDLWLHCGDTISRFWEDSLSFWTDNNLGNVANVLGNHDAWTQDQSKSDGTVVYSGVWVATQQVCYEKFFAPFLTSWGVTSAGTNKCYYYKDYTFSGYKIRFIALDCMHEDSAQGDWLESVLADAKANDMYVICCQHYKAGDRTPIECSFTSMHLGVSDTGSALSLGAQKVKDFIDAGGRFVCWLTGHTHYDNIYKCTGDTRQIGIHVDLASYTRGTDDASTRLGTPAMDCLNVVSFDLKEHLIKVFRIGRTYDRFLRHKNTLLLDYTTGEVVFNE